MHRSSPLVPLDSCLTAAACLSSACSFAVSQASDLALLVGYVTLTLIVFLCSGLPHPTISGPQRNPPPPHLPQPRPPNPPTHQSVFRRKERQNHLQRHQNF